MRSVRLLKKDHYHDEEVDAEGTWALSYGDMITLLVSFFVLFFTTDPKQHKIENSNRHLAFKIEGTVPVVPPVSSEKGKGPKVKMPEFTGLQTRAQSIEDNIVVSFQAVSFFKSGSIQISPQGEFLLKEFAEKYLPFAGSYRLSIKGFTDKRKVTRISHRKYTDNMELSALRSLAALRILQYAGVPLNRMEIAGAGELDLIDKALPRVSGLTKDELNAYSRTVVLVIQPIKDAW